MNMPYVYSYVYMYTPVRLYAYVAKNLSKLIFMKSETEVNGINPSMNCKTAKQLLNQLVHLILKPTKNIP